MIQSTINAGGLSLRILDPGRRVRLTFPNYWKQGDILSVDIEEPTNRLLAISVSSYMDSPNDRVTLATDMTVLPYGTIFPLRSVLDAAAKGVRVIVQNSGFQRIAR